MKRFLTLLIVVSFLLALTVFVLAVFPVTARYDVDSVDALIAAEKLA